MLKRRFEYKYWADARTLEAIASLDSAANPQSYAFVLQQINHMVIVEDLFRSRIEQQAAPHEATNSEIVPEYDELKSRLLESGDWYLNFVSALKPDDQKATISFQFADGKLGTMSMEEILFHIVNHGSYHRGSIAHALDLAGVAHPADGYGIFIHEIDASRRVAR